MKEKERKLLILDDNPEILDMITESLSIAGFSHLTRAASKKKP